MTYKEKRLKEFEDRFGVAYQMSETGNELITEVNYRTIKELEDFISQTIDELESRTILALTTDISKTEFIDNGKEQWEVLNDRGVEPCVECDNGFKIREFIKSLNQP